MVVPFDRTTAKLNAMLSQAPLMVVAYGSGIKDENALMKARSDFDFLGQALTENRL